LSFADFVMLVPRARAVRVEALDHQANPLVLELRGWPARILQHEVDHLHGVVCVDRMHSRSLCRAGEHARHWQGQSAEAVLAALAAPGETSPTTALATPLQTPPVDSPPA
jgi:peptide deformylase